MARFGETRFSNLRKEAWAGRRGTCAGSSEYYLRPVRSPSKVYYHLPLELEGSEQLNSPVLFNQTSLLGTDFLKAHMLF